MKPKSGASEKGKFLNPDNPSHLGSVLRVFARRAADRLMAPKGWSWSSVVEWAFMIAFVAGVAILIWYLIELINAGIAGFP